MIFENISEMSSISYLLSTLLGWIQVVGVECSVTSINSDGPRQNLFIDIYELKLFLWMERMNELRYVFVSLS